MLPAGMTGTALLCIRKLSVGFLTGPRGPCLRAVDGLDLLIPQRTSVGIVGESGSGKSVTALSILRLLPERLSRIEQGSILYYGVSGSISDGEPHSLQREPVDLATLPPNALRKLRGNRIAMIFQEPMTALNPVYPVGDQVGEALRAHRPVSRKQCLAEAVELLDIVGIPDAARRAKDHPHELSGGQRQRVMIAMALCCQPDLLIADEPTTALDVTTQAQILDLLRRRKEELGMSLLLISHDLGVIAEVCSVVAVMYAGQIVEQAAAHELFASPRHPYTAGLLAAMPRLHTKATRLREIPGRVPGLHEIPTGCRFAERCAYATDKCRVQAPLLETDAAGDGPFVHAVRCHYPLDGKNGGACA